MGAMGVPDVAGEVLAPGKYHAAVAVPSALEGLCWCRAVAFVDASDGTWHVVGVVVGDDGGHVVVVVVTVGGSACVVDGGVRGGSFRGRFALHATRKKERVQLYI